MEYLPILYIIIAIGGSIIKLINKNKEKTVEKSILTDSNQQSKVFPQPASRAKKKSAGSFDPYSLIGDLFDDFDPYQKAKVDQEELVDEFDPYRDAEADIDKLVGREHGQEKSDNDVPKKVGKINSTYQEYPKRSDLISVVERFPEEDYYDRVVNRKNFRLNLNSENLVQGIILSEVLGPPRAKRRYTPITNQNK